MTYTILSPKPKYGSEDNSIRHSNPERNEVMIGPVGHFCKLRGS